MIIKKIPSNYIAIRIPSEAHDTVTMKSGTKLFIDPKFNFAQHVNNVGIVEAIPEKLIFRKGDPNASMRWKTNIEVKVGDTVWINRMDMSAALGDKCADNAQYSSAHPNKYIENEDGTLTVFLRYDSIIFAKRGDRLFPVNGWLVIVPFEEEQYKGKVELLNRKNYNIKIGKVMFAGERILEYPFQGMEDPFNIEVGDVVYLPIWSEIPLEQELHQILNLGDNVFIVQRHRILETWNDIKGLFEQANIDIEKPEDVTIRKRK